MLRTIKRLSNFFPDSFAAFFPLSSLLDRNRPLLFSFKIPNPFLSQERERGGDLLSRILDAGSHIPSPKSENPHKNNIAPSARGTHPHLATHPKGRKRESCSSALFRSHYGKSASVCVCCVSLLLRRLFLPRELFLFFRLFVRP